jgi:hypothetical protein
MVKYGFRSGWVNSWLPMVMREPCHSADRHKHLFYKGKITGIPVTARLSGSLCRDLATLAGRGRRGGWSR